MNNLLDSYSLLLLIFIGSSIFLLSSNNSVYSVLYLILCFFCAVIILFLFNIEFLGLSFLIIYVGAIAVLFLFVVMMLNIKENVIILTLQDFIVPFLFFGLFYLCVKNTFFNFDYTIFYFYSFFDVLTNINLIGQFLYNYCLIGVLIAGFILLVAIIGPVVLTFTFNNKKNIFLYRRQLSRSENSLAYIKNLL